MRLDTTKTPKPHLVRRRVWEMVAIAYLVLTVVAVVVTANHFVLDVVGGALTFAAAATLGRVVSTRRPA